MVRHSNKKPLTIASEFSHVIRHAALRNLLQGGFRIKNLRLLVNLENLDTLCNYIHKFKRTLTHVELKWEVIYRLDDEDLDEDGAMKAILKNVARRLLSLKLNGFSMPQKLFSSPRLTKLHLRGGKSEMSSCEILEILELAPLLEYINLYYTAYDPEKLLRSPTAVTWRCYVSEISR